LTGQITRAEREALRDLVGKFLANEHPMHVVRRLLDTEHGYDASLWSRFSEGLGLSSLAVPEDYGGQGLGLAELAIVMEEMGGTLACLPYLSSAVLAGSALADCKDEEVKNRFLPQIARGLLATLALPFASMESPLRARLRGDDWHIDGLAPYVIDGVSSELLLVFASTDAGPSLFLIEGHAAGLSRKSLQPFDLTRRLASLEFHDVPARLIGSAGEADSMIKDVADRALVALSAEQLGAAKACLRMSVDYARTRFQFGRQIGSFQAIKHKCADMLLAVEMGNSALDCALEEEGGDNFSAYASLAKTLCSEALARCAVHNIQIHGGIGFTWEHDAHLYFRRAKSSQSLFGDAAFHRERYARLLLAPVREVTV
jgi:alkylation response protein AidB-like acyl-CoA dehydrogenase